jgi:hypothetical protein
MDVHGIAFAEGSVIERETFPPPLSVCLVAPLLPLYPLFAWQAYVRVVRDEEVVVDPAAALSIGDLSIERGDRLWLRRGGRVDSWLLGSPRDVRGHRLETGCVWFDEEGRIREIMLYRPQVLAGLHVFGSGLIGTQVVFDEAGRVRRYVRPDGARTTLDATGRVVREKPMRVGVALYSFRPDIAARARRAHASRPAR